MKKLLLILIIACIPCKLDSVEERQADILSAVRRDMRALYVEAFFENDNDSRAIYSLLSVLDKNRPQIVEMEPKVLFKLQKYHFIDENYEFNWERIDAWNYLKSLHDVDISKE